MVDCSIRHEYRLTLSANNGKRALGPRRANEPTTEPVWVVKKYIMVLCGGEEEEETEE